MRKPSRNDAMLLCCALLVAGMVGLSYAAVPLYRLFCAATGYGGTPARADRAPAAVDTSHKVTVRFDTNVDPALDWTFVAETPKVDVAIGENKLVFFRATNRSKEAVVGHAAFNVTPEQAAPHFAKIECFCFTEQKLGPGQSIEMPVSFFVDPAILTDRNSDTVGEITLSYTFYPAANSQTSLAANGPNG